APEDARSFCEAAERGLCRSRGSRRRARSAGPAAGWEGDCDLRDVAGCAGARGRCAEPERRAGAETVTPPGATVVAEARAAEAAVLEAEPAARLDPLLDRVALLLRDPAARDCLVDLRDPRRLERGVDLGAIDPELLRERGDLGRAPVDDVVQARLVA